MPPCLGLIENADLAIYDCTYLESEMHNRRGFGHSTWEQGVKLCKAAGAKRLALFHHDPVRTDAELAAMERQTADALARILCRARWPGGRVHAGQGADLIGSRSNNAEAGSHSAPQSRQSVNSRSRKSHADSSCTR